MNWYDGYHDCRGSQCEEGCRDRWTNEQVAAEVIRLSVEHELVYREFKEIEKRLLKSERSLREAVSALTDRTLYDQRKKP